MRTTYTAAALALYVAFANAQNGEWEAYCAENPNDDDCYCTNNPDDQICTATEGDDGDGDEVEGDGDDEFAAYCAENPDDDDCVEDDADADYCEENPDDSECEEDGEEDEESEEVEEELIDISAAWEDYLADEEVAAMIEEYEAYDEELWTEYWGYVEDFVDIVDAAVDAQVLYNTDFYDMEDFFESLDDDAWSELEAELTAAEEAYNEFMDGLVDNEAYQSALEEVLVLTMVGTTDDDGNYITEPYINWLTSPPSEDWTTEFGNVMAQVIDAETGGVVASIDQDALKDAIATFFAQTDNEAALAATMAEILNAWNAVKEDAESMVDTRLAAWDNAIAEYDAVIDDETHKTSTKLFAITNEIIEQTAENEDMQTVKRKAKNSMVTVNEWINQDDWDTVYDEYTDLYNEYWTEVKADIEGGLPEREYAEEEEGDAEGEEVPDNAFSFAASAAALLASAAVLSF